MTYLFFYAFSFQTYPQQKSRKEKTRKIYGYQVKLGLEVTLAGKMTEDRVEMCKFGFKP